MRIDMTQYAVYAAIKATFDQPPHAPRTPVADYVDWMAVAKIDRPDFNAALRAVEAAFDQPPHAPRTPVAKIDRPDFNAALRAVEAEIDLAKKRAAVDQRDYQRLFNPPPLKMRDQMKIDRERAAEIEADQRRGKPLPAPTSNALDDEERAELERLREERRQRQSEELQL